MGNPLPLDLAQECRKAQKILKEFVDPANGGLDRVIPMSVLKKAQGLAIFSVARLGFLMSARAGSGVVVARLPDDSWSPPSALGLGGVGAGFNAGVELTDFVIVLNSKQAVRSFMATGSLQLGGNLSVAVGPLGRAAEASGAVSSSGQIAAMFSYSKSRGLYGGVSVEGTILVDRSDANSKAYGRSITAKQVLSGNSEIPPFAEPLIALIEKFTLSGEVRTGMHGRNASARGYGSFANDDGYDSSSDIERELRKTQISSSPTDEWGYPRRSSAAGNREYAFASKGSRTNSPTYTRKSFLGNSTSSRGTDYTKDSTSDGVFDSTYMGYNRSRSNTGTSGEYDTFARSGVQQRSPSSSYAYDHSTSARTRSQVMTKKFATTFSTEDNSSDDERLPTTSRDPFETPADDDESLPYGRRSGAARISSYRDKLDDLDVELDRDANRKMQSYHADLMDFTNPTTGGGGGGSRRKNGMDSLDEELQRRDSMGTNSSHDRFSYEQARPAKTGWRADYGLPDETFAAPPSNRPPMHQRTSSAQKLWNRVRGNSNASSRNTSYNVDPWDRQYTSTDRNTPRPSGSRGGSRTTTPSIPRSMSTTITPPPAAFVAGMMSRSTSSTSAATPPPLLGGNSGEFLQVLAQFDFPGQEENDLAFKRGDIIDVLRKTENRDDWWLGKIGNRIANFPANYTVDL